MGKNAKDIYAYAFVEIKQSFYGTIFSKRILFLVVVIAWNKFSKQRLFMGIHQRTQKILKHGISGRVCYVGAMILNINTILITAGGVLKFVGDGGKVLIVSLKIWANDPINLH